MTARTLIPAPKAPGRLQSTRALIAGFIDPNPTEYHGIQMRSRLEADFARHLDERGEVWAYEPRTYGPAGKGYIPDFELRRPDGGLVFIEVKPTLAEVRDAARRMETIWHDEPDAILIVACAEECRYFSALPGRRRWASWVERWKHA